jgi:hypothetical protein
VGLALLLATCQGAAPHEEALHETAVPPGAVLAQPTKTTPNAVPEEEVAVSSTAVEEETVGGKPCAQRKDETIKLLKAARAARLVNQDSEKYGVDDETTLQLVHNWDSMYKKSQAEYVFYCTQTMSDLALISAGVKKKEALAVENAAQAGLIAAQATIKHKQEMAEKAEIKKKERAAKDEKAEKLRVKRAQEKTDKLADESIHKNTERLRRLPQITRNLYGQVHDAVTGKTIVGAGINSKCLFTNHDGISGDDGKYILVRAISGPVGRQCDITVTKAGYVNATFPITVMKGDTDSLFRESVMLPEIKDDQRFRFSIQYGANPPNLDAHILVPMPDDKYLDVGAAPLVPPSGRLAFGAKGASKELPFTTLDHAAMRFGPETASVHNVNDGVYHFMVSNAAQSFTTADAFHNSKARAFLYQGNKLLNTVAIDVAEGSPTQMWEVYQLACESGVCRLKVVNAFADKSPVH